jgi:hypothetical protein
VDLILKSLLLFFFVALAFILASILLTRRANRRRTPSPTYEALRDHALPMNREKIGLPAPSDPSIPWAVVMD